MSKYVCVCVSAGASVRTCMCVACVCCQCVAVCVGVCVRKCVYVQHVGGGTRKRRAAEQPAVSGETENREVKQRRTAQKGNHTWPPSWPTGPFHLPKHMLDITMSTVCWTGLFPDVLHLISRRVKLGMSPCMFYRTLRWCIR